MIPAATDTEECPPPLLDENGVREALEDVLREVDPRGPTPPEFADRLAAARDAYDATVAALGDLRRVEDAVAALRVDLVERLDAAGHAEAYAEGLDPWQAKLAGVGTRSELAAVLHLPAQTAAALTDRCTALVRERPRLHAALREGRMDWAQTVAVLDQVRLAGCRGPERVADVDALEAHLMRVAASGVTAAKLDRLARVERARRFPETVEAAARRARATRRLSLRTLDDGMSYLGLCVPSATAEAIHNRHTAIARALAHPDEKRTLAQRRADSATQALLGQGVPRRIGGDPAPFDPGHLAHNGKETVSENAASPDPATDPGPGEGWFTDPDAEEAAPADHRRFGPEPFWATDPAGGREPWEQRFDEHTKGEDAGGGSVVATGDGTVVDPDLGPLPRADILVTVPLLTLLGAGEEPGRIGGGGPIPASIARRLAAEAPSFLRVLTDPVTGEVLDLHPDRYRVSTVMRAWLRARDGTCAFKGCSAAATVTEIDHIVAWEDGGATVIENLHCLCTAHHLLKHLADRKDNHGHRPPGAADQPAIRAWTPDPAPGGHTKPGWTAPSGRHYPPDPPETSPPLVPGWVLDALNHQDQDEAGTPPVAGEDDVNQVNVTEHDDDILGRIRHATIDGIDVSVLEDTIIEYRPGGTVEVEPGR
ncbi:HNH endonuclease signature motif containing protein [Specibacter cremeus]|uniref:HNH endonuclease signature motif containing protein n=1 Tax=Specibacter cremeus TaxID=1629051 RepID=UPI000F786351|nr:HNH endonuclease signature motif containing protein [Specibacter cremeus]